jgi:hypothetical protein
MQVRLVEERSDEIPNYAMRKTIDQIINTPSTVEDELVFEPHTHGY